MQTAQQKLQSLLQSLFRADAADLDFGIYRIINHRRKEFETFINEELPTRVNAALDENAGAESARQELEKLATAVRRNLGDNALDADGNPINETSANFPVMQEYLAAKAEHDSPNPAHNAKKQSSTTSTPSSRAITKPATSSHADDTHKPNDTPSPTTAKKFTSTGQTANNITSKAATNSPPTNSQRKASPSTSICAK